MVLILMLVADVSLSLTNLALLFAVMAEPSKYSPNASCLQTTEQPVAIVSITETALIVKLLLFMKRHKLAFNHQITAK
ncbi:hypothetical protein [Comamonas sp. 4034]|uniref:hypothetical protein n=1 Tax=Comamonas sp. 4034 TaxID=3156455 RepID=UPI003D1AF932